MVADFVEFVRGLEHRDNVQAISLAELAEAARPLGRPTQEGSLAFFSLVRSRSGGRSVTLGSERVRQHSLTAAQQAISAKLDTTLEALQEYLRRTPLVRVQRTIGANPLFNPRCTLYLSSQRRASLGQGYLWASTLAEPSPAAPGPEIFVVSVPEWPEHDRQVLIFPEERLTVVLGIDYVGEVKMGFLRMAIWEAKQEGMLGLHAGTQLVAARDQEGRLRRYGLLVFGLSGTGKTTHTCHDHGLTDDGEGINILQDDIVFLREDGSALGTEQGFYLKTEGITPEHQPIVHRALIGPETLYENVMVDSHGRVDLEDQTLGSNGRAVVPRKALAPHVSDSINLPPLSEVDGLIIAFVTRRNTVLPTVSKLTIAQAVSAFMLGESIETSAGDPRAAGQSVRVVGTNPFVVGDEAEEGNWLDRFLQRHPEKAHCYLLNTGAIGEVSYRDGQGNLHIEQRGAKIGVGDSAALLRSIARNKVQWEQEPHFGTQAPAHVNGLSVERFRLEAHYTQPQIQDLVAALKQERREWLAQFPALRQEVLSALG